MSSSKSKQTKSKSKKDPTPTAGNLSSSSALRSSGFLLTCDAPMKQFINHLNDKKVVDKKFILEDLDATHLLIKGEAREEIIQKVENWMDENVFSTIAQAGENFDTS